MPPGANMRCAKCGTNNPPDNSFCAQCGTTLTRACLKCNADNPPASNFCGKCGAALASGGSSATSSPTAEPASRVSVAQEQPEDSLAADGERKTVTGLFADIK